mmetsp:Transcript_13009/g.56584  ORF Transcript_13009/g.56584 Transcript_13009/m.56584 type:complete len:99 (+) Transcript_13009:1506-1802(+)
MAAIPPPAQTATAVTACDDVPACDDTWACAGPEEERRMEFLRDVEVEVVAGRSDHGDAAIASEGRSHQSPRRRPNEYQSEPRETPNDDVRSSAWWSSA